MARLASDALDTGRRVASRRERREMLDHRKEAVLSEALDENEGKPEQDEAPFAFLAQHLRQPIDEDRADDRSRADSRCRR